MANLPTSSNSISLHLTDRALTPIVSSSHPSSSSTDPPLQSHPHRQSQAQALSSLTTAAITAYDSASRLGLGLPQRIMIEVHPPGPVIFHSYLNPQSSRRHQQQQQHHTRNHVNGSGILEQAREDLRPLSGTTEGSSEGGAGERMNGMVNGLGCGKDVKHNEEEEEEGEGAEAAVQSPPLLIATVVAASAAEVGEARRAAARLERMGREFQRQWLREQREQLEPVEDGEDG